MQLYLKYAKEKIKIADKPFAGGGEGNLYRILSPSNMQGYVAKLYHPFKLTPQRLAKIEFLYQNPPDEQASNAHPTFIWVKDILLDANKSFVGLIMPFVKGEKLEVLTAAKLPKHLSNDWNRFDPKNKAAFDLRLRICFNLAAALYKLHSSERYVLVDLKPDNVIIQSNGLLSLVDMDSVEVVENGLMLFPAPVSTPEYTPPEYYIAARDHEQDAINASWDLFSMMVIFYRLMFGIHPFAASAKPPYDNMVSLHDKISVGLFVHHPEKQDLFSVIPPPHKAFLQLGEDLRNLFIQGLALGHDNPEIRPLAEEWCMTLANSFADETLKAHFQKIMLQKGGTSRRFRSPSAATPLPQSRFAPKDLLPAEYHLLLNWAVPAHKFGNFDGQPSLSNAKNKNSWLPTLFSFIICICSIVPFANMYPGFKKWLQYSLWEYSTLTTLFILQLMFLVPFLIMPLVYRLYIYPFANPEFSKWRNRMNLFKTLQKEVFKQQEEFLKIQKQVVAFFQKDINASMSEITEKVKQIRSNFESWLKEQDLVFEAVATEEKAAITAAQLPFLDKVKTMPEFEKYKDIDSFNKLRLALHEDKKEKIATIQAEGKIKGRNIQMTHELKTEIKSQINKIEEEKKAFLQTINGDFAFLLLQKKQDESALQSTYSQEANINKNYRKYLKDYAGNIKQIANNLVKAGLNSILQIESINHLKYMVYLKDGKSIDLENMTNSGAISLAGKLEDWMIAVSKLQQKAEDERLKIQKTYERMYAETKEDERKGLLVFENRVIAVQNEAAALSIELEKQKLDSVFAEQFALLDAAETECKDALVALSESFTARYRSLQEACRNALETSENEIETLEKQLQQKVREKISLSGLEKVKTSGIEKIKLVEKSVQKAYEEEAKLKKIYY